VSLYVKRVHEMFPCPKGFVNATASNTNPGDIVYERLYIRHGANPDEYKARVVSVGAEETESMSREVTVVSPRRSEYSTPLCWFICKENTSEPE
jgi:hypothetical protein